MEFKVSLEDIIVHEEEWRNSTLTNAGLCLMLAEELKKQVSNNHNNLYYPIKIPKIHRRDAILEVFQKITNDVHVNIKPEGNYILVSVGDNL